MSLRLTLATTALVIAAATPAAADVFSMRAEIHGGGAGGVGVAGGAKDRAFSEGARGAAYGALLGGELLFVDAWLEHHQYTDGSLLGTWTQFMTGFDVDIALGKQPPLAGAKDKKSAPAKGFLELGLAVGYGIGTGQQVSPPLDNAQLTDKGFLIEGRFAAGWNLNRIISLGFALPVSYGYLFKSRPGEVANDDDNQYQAIQVALLLNRLKTKTHMTPSHPEQLYYSTTSPYARKARVADAEKRAGLMPATFDVPLAGTSS